MSALTGLSAIASIIHEPGPKEDVTKIKERREVEVPVCEDHA
jgi:hypothetical protein